MKKGPLLLVLIAILSPLYSMEVYQSNMLGQRLNPKEAFEKKGWEKTIDESSEKLYQDGVLYSEKKLYNDGYEIIENGSSERVFYDDEGTIIRRIITSGEASEEYNYFYEGNNLSKYNYSSPDGTLSSVSYISTDSGKLVSFEREYRSYIAEDFYVYNLDGENVRIEIGADGGVSRASDKNFTSESLEGGGYKEIWEGYELYYSPEGRLIREVYPDKELSYTYLEDGSLDTSKLIEGENTTVTYYVDGNKSEALLYVDDILESQYIYYIEGYVEEYRYLDGKPSYRLVYDRDGKRLMGIEKL